MNLYLQLITYSTKGNIMNKKNRIVSRSGAKLSIGLFGGIIIFGIFLAIMGAKTDPKGYNIPKRDSSGRIIGFEEKWDDGDTPYIVFGVLIVISGFSGLISSGLTLQALDELGVDAIPAQDLKRYKKQKREAKVQNLSNRQQPNTNFQNNNKQFYNHSNQNTGNFSNNMNGYQSVNNGYNNTSANYANSNNNAQNTVIEICPACKQKLRFPSGKGQMEATCPRCNYAFYIRT